MKKGREIVGTSFYCTMGDSHLAKDLEFGKMFRPEDVMRYYPETINIEEEMVFIGVISLTMTKPEMVAVPLAKLIFSETQFVSLLKHTPGLYQHFLKVIRGVDISLGSRKLSYAEMHRKLKENFPSSQNIFTEEECFEPEYTFEDEE